MRKTSFILLSALISGTFLLSGCGQPEQASPARSAQQQAVPVDIVTLSTEAYDVTERYVGRANAFRTAEIRPQVNGILTKRLFEEGAYVETGQALFQIDASLYEAALAQAESQLAVAKANFHSASLTYNRYKELINTNAISQQNLDDAEATWQQTQAQVKVAEAGLKSAKVNLQYTQVTAPISGIIGRSLVTEGALVSAQQSTALAIINQLSPIYVDIKQPVLAMQQMRQSGLAEKQHVPVRQEGTEHVAQGELQFSESSIDINTDTVTVRIKVDNEDHWLLPGMFVSTDVVLKTLPNAVLVPQQGVQQQPSGQMSAMVVNQQGVVESRAISVEKAVKGRWLVKSGLKAGDKVIVRGLQKIRPGAPVAPNDVTEQFLSNNQKGE